ncbi:MAG: hypothetical protein QM604_05425 [Microbacterium sp.]
MITPTLSGTLTARVARAACDWVRLPILSGVQDGTLDPRIFRNYLEQDYLYLRYYARIYARLAAAATTHQELAHFIALAAGTLDVELDHHIAASAPFGCDFAAARPSPQLAAYLAFYDELADDRDATLVAMLPCAYGYAVALDLIKDGELGAYADWVGMYTSGAYAQITARHLAMIDGCAIDVDRAVAIVERGLALEHGFWNQLPEEAVR